MEERPPSQIARNVAAWRALHLLKSRIAGIGLVLCAFAIGSPARPADDQPEVAGTWQVSGYSQEYLDTKETTHPAGDRPTGYIQYSPGGHMVVFIAGDLPRPARAIYTDVDRAAVHRNIFGAYAGTYKVEGNRIIHHILTSWRPEWNGGDQIRFFETDGKTLTIKTAPIKSTVNAGREFVSIITFVRVE